MFWPAVKRIKINTPTVVFCVLNDILNLISLWWLNISIHIGIGIVIMKGVLILTLVYLFRCEGAVVVNAEILNERPIIGVLSQEQSHHLHKKYTEENYTSYIAASYVKNVESSGARVVPIMIGKDREYYENIMRKINGVLLPGGGTYFNQSNGYADAGQHIYEIAQELNDAGDYFPVFGTCLGFELLLLLASGRKEKENREKCRSYENLPVGFTNDFRNSRMFAKISDEVHHILANENVTYNQHQFCITDHNMEAYNLTKDWRVMSYNHDEKGLEFISSVEHKRYPIYGVQFHPEKSAFEWKLSKNYPESPNSIIANRHFMDFFVSECRKSHHKFANIAEEQEYLIYNYKPYYTGVLGSAYEQCYMFEPRGTVAS